MKSLCKMLICLILVLIIPAGCLADTRVPVLLYHSVRPVVTKDMDPKMHVSTEVFTMHLRTLKDNGYQTITYDQYTDYVKNGAVLPQKPLIINFDDGYEDNYTYAYPILKSMNMKATIFILTEYMGLEPTLGYPHFTWEQARELDRSGFIDIESHTMSHPKMAEISYETTLREMRLSKYLIEKNLNKECKYMAYPNGIKNPWTSQIAKDAGYELMCKVGDKGSNDKTTDLYDISRLTVSNDMDGAGLVKYIEENIK